jgi:hypothetical protein
VLRSRRCRRRGPGAGRQAAHGIQGRSGGLLAAHPAIGRAIRVPHQTTQQGHDLRLEDQPLSAAGQGPDRKEVGAVQWDLGLQGLGLLVAMSFGFGVIAQLVAGRAMTRWLWLVAAAGYLVGGLFTSEVWFGWATQEELQPNIDGLSFDEVLLFGLLSGIVTVFVTWYVTRRTRRPSSNGPSKRSGTHSRRPPAGAV